MCEITNEAQEFEVTRDNLRRVGVELVLCPGEFRVNYIKAGEASACYFEELAAAKAAGYRMAENAQTPLPPIGPCGRRNTKRGQIYRHNTKLLNRGFWKKGGA